MASLQTIDSIDIRLDQRHDRRIVPESSVRFPLLIGPIFERQHFPRDRKILGQAAQVVGPLREILFGGFAFFGVERGSLRVDERQQPRQFLLAMIPRSNRKCFRQACRDGREFAVQIMQKFMQFSGLLLIRVKFGTIGRHLVDSCLVGEELCTQACQ